MPVYDAYIRVSQVRGREGESFISPTVQREQIDRWAALRGVTIGEYHTDLDQTGGKLSRPALDRALARIESGESQGLAVARLDRLSRAGVGDALKLVEWLSDHNAQVAVVDLGIDPTTVFGEFAMTIMLALARMERRRTKETWSIAQERAVARGVHIASKTPTGYQRRDDGRLEPHPTAGPVIGEVFAMRAGGGSWRQLADHLNRSGVVGPYGSPHWPARSCSHIIANRVYLGEARSGEHVNVGAHQPLTDRATWELAQVARGAPATRSEQPAVLAGLLRCAGCRHTLKPDRMTLPDKSRPRMYRCRGEHSQGRCEDRSATLERVVLPVVEARFFAEVGEMQVARVEQSADLAQLTEAADQAEAELVGFRDDERIAGVLGRDRYVEGLSKRAEVAERTQAALFSARQRTGGLPLELDVREVWDDLEAVEKQKLLGMVFDAVMLRSGRSLAIDDRLHFVARGEAPDDMPRRGKRFPLKPFLWPDDPPGGAGVARA